MQSKIQLPTVFSVVQNRGRIKEAGHRELLEAMAIIDQNEIE